MTTPLQQTACEIECEYRCSAMSTCLQWTVSSSQTHRNQDDFWKLSVTRYGGVRKRSELFSTGKQIGLSVTSTHAASLNRTHCIMTVYLCAKTLQHVQNCRPQDGEILPCKQLHKTSTFIQYRSLFGLTELDKCSEVVMLHQFSIQISQ